jgi:hypothetical protein
MITTQHEELLCVEKVVLFNQNKLQQQTVIFKQLSNYITCFLYLNHLLHNASMEKLHCNSTMQLKLLWDTNSSLF